MLLLSRREVASLLSMPACVELMADALASLARGEVILPLRPVIRIPETLNAFAVMPAYSAALQASGAKLISVYPDNHGSALDSHQGVVVLFDGADGKALALMDAASITAIRTAAVSGVATRVLARKDARVALIVGAGVQGATHVDAMLAVHPFERVLVWSRSASRAQSLASRMATAHGVDVSATADLAAAVGIADVICTVTAAREPVLRGAWLRAGTHVNAVGASVAAARELDTEAVARAELFVDRRESALNEAGDVLIPLREGAFGQDHIRAELGQVLTGVAPGRGSDHSITLFKSLGLAVEDLACAHFLHQRATEQGMGTWVDL